MGETESLNTLFVLIQTIDLCLDLKKKRMFWLDLHNDFLISTRFAIIGHQRNKENIWIER